MSSNNRAEIDFLILSPNNVEIYARKSKTDGIFKVKLTEAGFYTLVFNNRKVNKN